MKITSTKLKKRLFFQNSDFQKIEVYETNFGKSLFLDDIEQFSEFDEIEYHDTMTKIPLCIHGEPNNVLIIGGGDGGIARECLKYDTIQFIDQCEIDKQVVSVCKEYFPQMASSLDDSRVNLTFDDAKDFVKSVDKKYDIILVDSTDPVNQSEPLFKKDFYKDLKNILKDDGLLSCQVQTSALNHIVADEVYNSLYEVFDYLNFFFCTYLRDDFKDNTLFSLSANKQIDIPKKFIKYFRLDSKQYKKTKTFLNKLNWIKNE
jgi:spermidine synthase